MDFTSELKRNAADVEIVLNQLLPETGWDNAPANVARYATLDAGKRLRTFLTVQVAGLFDADYTSAIHAGAAIEMVHNFSLIHDDLPCIDNDTLRRGRPSAWAKYGERNAVLAGDFLISHAFGVLATDEHIKASDVMRLKMVRTLSLLTSGMIQGEWQDCEAESNKSQTAAEIDEIQSLKTGQIFLCCALFGAILGNANDEQIAALTKFVDAMGLCFQITDDILDATGDEAKVGKTLHKDDAAGKATYVSLLGLDGARAKAAELADAAKDALVMFGDKADTLRGLMDYMVKRES